MRSHFSHFVIAAVGATLVFFGCKAWYDAVVAKSVAVAEVRNQIAVRTEAAKRFRSVQTALAEVAGDTTALKDYFISENGLASFAEQLKAQGRGVGANVTILSVSTSTKSAQPTFIFSLSVTGTFDAVLRAVGAIESLPYDLSVADLSLAQGNGSEWRANFTLITGSLPAVLKTL